MFFKEFLFSAPIASSIAFGKPMAASSASFGRLQGVQDASETAQKSSKRPPRRPQEPSVSHAGTTKALPRAFQGSRKPPRGLNGIIRTVLQPPMWLKKLLLRQQITSATRSTRYIVLHPGRPCDDMMTMVTMMMLMTMTMILKLIHSKGAAVFAVGVLNNNGGIKTS